ncbi:MULTISPECIES: SHOCT domain-containing protein [unclassified Streptomyces]|uniref:SHOCT domain-containing protein n=1 Tax=unclassified Streptomyces TaxID=2593676 RepID=UPI0022511C07|nr:MULTISPECIES: SHOCT domain-containing protein [unclassified Streptomyces]MCX5144740.1 SHOCT domain-containing protein [Streptomyces sp. NBC_00338]WSU56962.1 SHOCT domain-containing protein [Streptomyces sp. NBC_01104]
MNRRGPGLLGAVARTAVVAGTASAVSGRVQRHQQARFADDDADQLAEEQMRQQMQMQAAQQQASQQQAAQQQAAEPAPDDLISRLERLAELKKQGILTDAEFNDQKMRLLAE